MKILDGNAFKLCITCEQLVEEYRAATDMSQVDNLMVAFNRRGRILQTSYVDNVGRIMASNSGNLALGVYGVELTGYYNGEPWRFYASEVFEIVNEGGDSASSVVDGIPIYNVTFAVTLGDGADISFVDTAIINHNGSDTSHSDIRQDITQLQEDVANAGKVDDVKVNGVSVVSSKEANITVPTKTSDLQNDSEFVTESELETALGEAGHVDDVKVNGSSVVSNKEANITIPTKVSDLQNDLEFASQNDLPTDLSDLQEDSTHRTVTDEEKEDWSNKQDPITNVGLEYEEDGGEPDASVGFQDGNLLFSMKNMKMKFADLTAEDKEELRGPQGKPGESVLVGQGDLPLANTLGSGSNIAISQKAVTDEILKLDLIKVSELGNSTFAGATGVYPNNGEYKSSSNYRNYWFSYDDSVAQRGNYIKVTPQTGKYISFCFVKQNAPVAGNSVVFVDNYSGYITGATDEAKRVQVPNDTEYIGIRVKIGEGTDYSPSKVEFFEEKTIAEVIEMVNESVDHTDSVKANIDDENYQKLLKSAVLTLGYTVAPRNLLETGKFGTSSNYEHGFIPVKKGEKYIIDNYGTSLTRYAFATTDASTGGGDVPVVSGTSVTTLSAGNKVIVEIPEGCTFLLFNITNISFRIYRLYNNWSLQDITPALTVKASNKYIGTDGGSHSSSYYEYYNLVTLKRGDIVILESREPGGSNVVQISAWDENDTKCQKIIAKGKTSNNKAQYVVEDETEYIRFCRYNRSGYTWTLQILRPMYDTPLTVIKDNAVKESMAAAKELTKPLFTKNWAYALCRTLCLGDSLTRGAYYGVSPNFNCNENYPFFLAKMLGSTVTNGGKSGASASDYYTSQLGNYTLTNYDSFIIWFGTNNGLTDTLAADVDPYEDYNDFAATETGYYCKIISKIKAQVPDAFIVLAKVFAGGSPGPATTNAVIDKIAQKYGLLVVDNSDLSQSAHPELHININNPHFGKTGNIFLANRFVEKIGEYIANSPMRAEFGITH